MDSREHSRRLPVEVDRSDCLNIELAVRTRWRGADGVPEQLSVPRTEVVDEDVEHRRIRGIRYPDRGEAWPFGIVIGRVIIPAGPSTYPVCLSTLGLKTQIAPVALALAQQDERQFGADGRGGGCDR